LLIPPDILSFADQAKAKVGIYSYSSEHPVSDFLYASENRMVVALIMGKGILQFYARSKPLWGIHPHTYTREHTHTYSDLVWGEGK
jgi:hypothetical protein